MSFYNGLKKYRLKKGLTQYELASLANVGKWTITKYETARRVPSEQLRRHLADVLGVTYEQIMDE